MSDPATSPEISHEENDEEQIDMEDDPEEMAEEDVHAEGEGEDQDEEDEDEDDDEKHEDQEGLDLEVGEEDGMGSQDDLDGEHETENLNGDHQINEEEDRTSKEDAKRDRKPIEGKVGGDKEEPSNLLTRPPHGSEVFIGGISKDTTEDDLRELCVSRGDVYEVRLLKEKDKGENKGYAFVTFTNKESAEKAIETLNNSEVNGKKLRFSKSQSKHRIFIGNIPKDWDTEELKKSVEGKGPGIENVELVKDPQNPFRNRGFAFIEYYNHACAENARRNMSRPDFKLGNNTPTVSWADPRSEPDSAAMLQVKVVYVRNLPETATQEQIQELFERHGEITKVVLPAPKPGQPKRDFGFVHFSERSSALKAIEKSATYELEGRMLETSLAKPPTERKSEGAFNAQRAGLLPQYQSRMGYGYPGPDMYGSYNQQALSYARGPPPAGMTMVPMYLPDGRLGYVLQQQAGMQSGSAPYRTDKSSQGRASQRQSQGRNDSSEDSRRYRPY